jgi:hypothetical protein
MATVTYPVAIGSLIPSATVPPENVRIEGTNFPNFGYAFADATADEIAYTERLMIPNYGSGNVSVLIDWYSRTGQTSNAVVWGAALSVLTPADAQSVETDAFATENTQTTTVSGTARALNRTTVTVSNLDSLAANDSMVVRLKRLQSSGSDTMSGDAIIVGVTLQYSDT